MEPKLSDCLVLNTVMAARTLMRRYDAQLRPFGISTVQFWVLATIRSAAGKPVSEMAKRIAVDRTTMVRNLELLVRDGLVEAAPASSGNGREFTLTDAGNGLLDRLLPFWRNAQINVREHLGEEKTDETLEVLRMLTRG